MDPVEPIDRKWRVGPPTSGVAGSLYDFVRRYLCSRRETCSRAELLAALMAEPSLKNRLAQSQGFTALLNNMRHSGDVALEGKRIIATVRTLQRVGIAPKGNVK